MMRKREGQKIKKYKIKLDLKFCVFREEHNDDEKIMSSPNFFKLLTTFSPIERFLADSILLWGT